MLCFQLCFKLITNLPEGNVKSDVSDKTFLQDIICSSLYDWLVFPTEVKTLILLAIKSCQNEINYELPLAINL